MRVCLRVVREGCQRVCERGCMRLCQKLCVSVCGSPGSPTPPRAPVALMTKGPSVVTLREGRGGAGEGKGC